MFCENTSSTPTDQTIRWLKQEVKPQYDQLIDQFRENFMRKAEDWMSDVHNRLLIIYLGEVSFEHSYLHVVEMEKLCFEGRNKKWVTHGNPIRQFFTTGNSKFRTRLNKSTQMRVLNQGGSTGSRKYSKQFSSTTLFQLWKIFLLKSYLKNINYFQLKWVASL